MRRACMCCCFFFTLLLPVASFAFLQTSSVKRAAPPVLLEAFVDECADRRAFLTTVAASALLFASSAQSVSAEDKPKVLVLGGSGMVGTQIVKKLKALGIDVVATSRNGRDDTVAFDVLKGNVAKTVEELAKGCTGVISTIGVIGTPDDGSINAATGLAAEGAKTAGSVKNFVYISVAPEVKEFAKGFEFLNKYMDGKAFSEDSISYAFGDGNGLSYTLIEPTFIYGGDKFAVNPPRVATPYGKLVETVLSSGPFRAATNVAPEGFVKIALEPPVSAETVAAAAVSAALGKTPTVLDTYDKIQDAANLL